MKNFRWTLQLTFLIILSLFIVISTTTKGAEAASITEIINQPMSTPLVGADGQIAFPNSTEDHWWLIDYWDKPSGGSLPTIMTGDFVAVNDTFTEMNRNDAVLYLPLNVAYGQSRTNCVWFQFDLQMNNPLYDPNPVHMLIWDILGPALKDSDYHYTEIPISYIVGHEYYFSLTPSGTNTITFYIQDKTNSVSWSKSQWKFTVPNTNLLADNSMFSPASAVEGYTTLSAFSSVPFFQTKVGDNVLTHRYSSSSLGYIPSGISTSCFATIPSGFWNWEMQPPPKILPNLFNRSFLATSGYTPYVNVTQGALSFEEATFTYSARLGNTKRRSNSSFIQSTILV